MEKRPRKKAKRKTTTAKHHSHPKTDHVVHHEAHLADPNDVIPTQRQARHQPESLFDKAKKLVEKGRHGIEHFVKTRRVQQRGV